MSKLDIQSVRKENLKLVIDEYAKGSVDIFSKAIGKHRTYVYALLKNMNKNHSRAIASKVARFIEEYYKIPPLSLDNPHYREEFKPSRHKSLDELILELNPSFIDDKFFINNRPEDEKFTSIILAELAQVTDRNIYYYKIHDDLMAPNFEKGDIAFIDLTGDNVYKEIENGTVYFIKYARQFHLARIYIIEHTNQLKVQIDNPLRQLIFPQIVFSLEDSQKIIRILGKVLGKFSINPDVL